MTIVRNKDGIWALEKDETEVAVNQAIEIFDTTLRDGTQAENINFSSEEKVKIAKKLDELGVQYVEGGWPSMTAAIRSSWRQPTSAARKRTARRASIRATWTSGCTSR